MVRGEISRDGGVRDGDVTVPPFASLQLLPPPLLLLLLLLAAEANAISSISNRAAAGVGDADGPMQLPPPTFTACHRDGDAVQAGAALCTNIDQRDVVCV